MLFTYSTVIWCLKILFRQNKLFYSIFVSNYSKVSLLMKLRELFIIVDLICSFLIHFCERLFYQEMQFLTNGSLPEISIGLKSTIACPWFKLFFIPHSCTSLDFILSVYDGYHGRRRQSSGSEINFWKSFNCGWSSCNRGTIMQLIHKLSL